MRFAPLLLVAWLLLPQHGAADDACNVGNVPLWTSNYAVVQPEFNRTAENLGAGTLCCCALD